MRNPVQTGSLATCDRHHRISYTHPQAEELVAAEVRQTLAELGATSASNVVVFCIGTDRSTGDALGPLVGSILSVDKGLAARVLGTLDDPVHAGNLKASLELLGHDPGSRVVLAIDACLGQSEQVGTICVGRGPIRPGAGVNKDLPWVGDMHVTGTVNVGGFMEYLVLQNTRLSLVLKMAQAIARGLAGALAEP
ncbi:MAG: spore protease YyaC [Bacillota bacterium]